MKNIIVMLAVGMISLFAASSPRTVTSPSEIKNIVSEIPVTDKGFNYKSVGDRLNIIGLKVSSIRIDTVGKGEDEPPYYKVGDQIIAISTAEPNSAVKAQCPIAGNPTYVKRGQKFIPDNRTAYWLMHNRCDSPAR